MDTCCAVENDECSADVLFRWQHTGSQSVAVSGSWCNWVSADYCITSPVVPACILKKSRTLLPAVCSWNNSSSDERPEPISLRIAHKAVRMNSFTERRTAMYMPLSGSYHMYNSFMAYSTKIHGVYCNILLVYMICRDVYRFCGIIFNFVYLC